MPVFVDKVRVKVKAGRGGNGVVSWRREKYEDRGGPNGGDGGDGGNVVFRGDKNLNTLHSFRYNQLLKAEDGEPGSKQKKHGKRGEDKLVSVPLGTQVYLGDKLIADIDEAAQAEIVGKGGKGGFGNAHFKSSRRRAPRVAEKGEDGAESELTLELKLIADVGLVGLPNAGKSTLLSVVSNARPEIADYPFTTLSPNLGVVDLGKTSILFADIPGLIEGASQGKGLGDEFLRHVERTAVLIHLVDIHSDNIEKDYNTIIKELKDYKIDLTEKPSVVVLSRIDGLDKKTVKAQLKKLKKVVGDKVFSISSVTRDGLEDLLVDVAKKVRKARKEQDAAAEEEDEAITIRLPEEEMWKVEKVKGVWMISGEKIEKFTRKTDQNNQWGIRRLKDIMRKIGIMHELIRQGAKPGDKAMVGDIEIEI